MCRWQNEHGLRMCFLLASLQVSGYEFGGMDYTLLY